MDRTLQRIVRDIKTLQKKVGKLSTIEKRHWDSDIAAVDGHMIPADDSIYDLGSVTHKWANVYSDAIAGVLSGAEWEHVGASMMIDAHNAAQHTIVYVRNEDGTYEADLDVERNIVVGGTVDGVDIAALDAAVLKKDGSVALTADWDAGSFKATAEQFESDVATGTPPFVVASETVVPNLNVDMLDGLEAADFVVLAPATSARNTIQPSADVVPLTVRGDASQTENLQEWQNGAGAVLSYVSDDGLLSSHGVLSDTNVFIGTSVIGAGTLAHTTSNEGYYNVAIGYWAMYDATTAFANVAIGNKALEDILSGSYNVAIGSGTAPNVTSGQHNMAIGEGALYAVTTESHNVAIGRYAMGGTAATASDTVAIGSSAARYSSGGYNVCLGQSAGLGSATSTFTHTVAVGAYAGQDLTTGLRSVLIGYQAGTNITQGHNNIMIGYRAGDNLTTGSQNIIIGYDLDASAPDVSSELKIGGTFTIISGNTGAGGSLTLSPDGDIILDPTGNDVLPGSHRDINLGATATWYATGYIDQLEVGTIKSAVFETQEIHVFNGSFMVAKASASLAVAKTFAASGADTFLANDTGKFEVGDFLRLKDLDSDTWLEVTGIGSDPTINVTVESGGSESFVAGNTIVNYGASGQGMLLLTADDLGTVAGPAISVFDHAGVPWTTQTEYVRLGNLNGWGGFSADKWGIGLGEYAANVPNFYVNASDGVMKMRIYTTDYMVLDYNGGSPTAQIVGELDVTSPGKVTAGGGNIFMDSGGLGIAVSTSHADDRAVRFMNGATVVASVGAYRDSNYTELRFEVDGDAALVDRILMTVGDANTGGVVYIQTYDGSGSSSVLNIEKSAAWSSSDKWLFKELEIGGPIISGTGDITFAGNLISYKNSTDYTVYGFAPLASPLTSTSWDGDARSTTSKTLIDLSSVFSAPAGIKAVLVSVAVRDSGSAGGDYWFLLSPNNTANQGLSTDCHVINDRYARSAWVVPCDSNGDIYFQCSASGSLTMDVVLEIWGYWI